MIRSTKIKLIRKAKARTLKGLAAPVEDNISSGMSVEELRLEIARLQRVNNRSRVSKLHKKIMYLSKYYTCTGNHHLAPLAMPEFHEVFRLCDIPAPQISDTRLAEFNEIHRCEPLFSTDAEDNMTHEEIRKDITRLICEIDWT